MFSAGEGLDPTTQEPPVEDAGLPPEGEPPVAGEETPSEPPQGDEPADEVSVEGADSDEAIFTALEKDVPEELKPKALEVRKRLQGYLTKKTQEMSRNQITPELAKEVNEYRGLEQMLRTDPKKGLREITRRLQVLGYIQSPDGLLAPDAVPEAPIDPSTISNWEEGQKYFNQELQRRDVLINKLQARLDGFADSGVRSENRTRGIEAVTAAAKVYQGFAAKDKAGNIVMNERGEPQLTPLGRRAVQLILDGKINGPESLEIAWQYVSTPALRGKLEQLEKTNRTITTGLKGAQLPPGGKPPIRTDGQLFAKGNVFDIARQDVEQNGLGV